MARPPKDDHEVVKEREKRVKEMRKGKTWFHRDVVIALPALPPLTFSEGDRSHLAELVKKCYEDMEQARPKLEWHSHKLTNLDIAQDNPPHPPGTPYVRPAWTFISSSSPRLSREEKDYAKQLKAVWKATTKYCREADNIPATLRAFPPRSPNDSKETGKMLRDYGTMVLQGQEKLWRHYHCLLQPGLGPETIPSSPAPASKSSPPPPSDSLLSAESMLLLAAGTAGTAGASAGTLPTVTNLSPVFSPPTAATIILKWQQGSNVNNSNQLRQPQTRQLEHSGEDSDVSEESEDLVVTRNNNNIIRRKNDESVSKCEREEKEEEERGDSVEDSEDEGESESEGDHDDCDDPASSRQSRVITTATTKKAATKKKVVKRPAKRLNTTGRHEPTKFKVDDEYSFYHLLFFFVPLFLILFCVLVRYETPPEAWDMILNRIPQSVRLFDPFFCTGRSGCYISKKGFQIIHEDRDFFKWTPESSSYDAIVTNPPFSLKRKVLPRLQALGKPYALLIPLSTTTRQYFSAVMANTRFKIFTPKRRIQFLKDGQRTKNCTFESVWLLAKGMENYFAEPGDFIFEGDNGNSSLPLTSPAPAPAREDEQ